MRAPPRAFFYSSDASASLSVSSSRLFERLHELWSSFAERGGSLDCCEVDSQHCRPCPDQEDADIASETKRSKGRNLDRKSSLYS